ncbi:hypothetical protein [Actinokineospora pegani]|uniref:hypothetical protein n=1 Tax=Actinokineospora pegani TaxID=2654637 RepID=UPI0012EA88C2|nr:hypothetical protein [Actinokineospora pegani]
MSHLEILHEFGELQFARPGLNASPEVVAAWYRRKAGLFARIAERGGPEAADAAHQARLAATRAERVLADGAQQRLRAA